MISIEPQNTLLQPTMDNYDLFGRIYDFQDNKKIHAPFDQVVQLANEIGILKDFANVVMEPFFSMEGFKEYFSQYTISNPILATIDSNAIVKRMFPANQGEAKLSYMEVQTLKDNIMFQKNMINIIKSLLSSSALMVNFRLHDFNDNFQYAGFSFARHKLQYINPNKLINPVKEFDPNMFEYFNVIFTNNPDLSEDAQNKIKEEFFGDDNAIVIVVGEDKDMMSLTFVLSDRNNTIVEDSFDLNYQNYIIKSDFSTMGRYLPKSNNESNISAFQYYTEIIWNTLVTELKLEQLLVGDCVTWGCDRSEIQIASLNLFNMQDRFDYMQQNQGDPINQMIFMTAPDKTLIQTANAGAAHTKPFKNQRLDEVRIGLRKVLFNAKSPVYNKLMNNLSSIEDESDE